MRSTPRSSTRLERGKRFKGEILKLGRREGEGEEEGRKERRNKQSLI